MCARTAYARNADINCFRAKARRGEIPDRAVVPMAVVLAAARNAQIAIGPGHDALDAMVEAVPQGYLENWLKKRQRR